MPNLLENADLSPLTNVNEKAVVSLAELLLSEEQQEMLIVKREAERASAKTTKSTRASRLTKTRSASTVARGKSAAPIQKSEQKRKGKKKQEEEKKRLQEYQLQEGKKKGGTSQAPGLDAKKNANQTVTDARENSLIINDKLRPTIFGMLDFLPTFDSTGEKATSAGNILKINRAIKVLNAESLPTDIDVSDQDTLSLEYMSAYMQYIGQIRTFFDSLDASNFSFLEDIISLLELSKETSTTCSNSQLLVTILRDYATAVENCSPRLFEAEEREFPESGASLPEKVTGLDALKSVLKSDKAFDYLGAVLGDDQERALKILLYQISAELKMSYNVSKYGKNYDASTVVQTSPALTTVVPSKNAATNSLGLRQFVPAPEGSSENSFLFPLEKRDILPDDSGIKFNSAPDVIGNEEGGSHSTSVYSTMASSVKTACTELATLLDTGDFTSTYAPSVGAFVLIMQEIVLPLLESLTDKTPSRKTVVEFLLLTTAATDQKILAQLMLYLAALKEELSRPATEDNLTTSSKAKVVGSLVSAPVPTLNTTSDFEISQLSEAVFSSASTPTAVSTTKISSFAPTTKIGAVTLSSPTTKSSGRTSLSVSTPSNAGEAFGVAVTKSAIVTTTAKEADALAAAIIVNPSVTVTTTIASSYSTEYSDICDSTAALLIKVLSDVRTSGSVSGYLTALTQNNIASSLRSISTSSADGDVFIALLTLFDDFIEMFASSEATCFNGGSTAHSGIARGNIEIAFFMCICKMQYFSGYKAYELSSNETDTEGIDLYLDTDRLGDINETFVSALEGDIDLDDLSSGSDSLGRILDSLIAEEADIATFPATFSEFFDNISTSFSAVRDALDVDTDDTTATLTLRERIRQGLPVSSDLAMELAAYTQFYNSDSATFSSFKTRDLAVNDVSLTFLSEAMKETSFLENKKILAIALPAGLCDAIYNVPISLEESTRENSELSTDTFKIEIEKINLTRPTLKFKQKIFSFPRNIKINSFYQKDESSIGTNYSVFDSSLAENTYTEESLLEVNTSSYLTAQLQNLKNDRALKMYTSLLYDVDFSILNYPIEPISLEEISKKFVILGGATGIDTASDNFLSGSNLAFDPLERSLASFDWYESASERLSLDVNFGNDPTAFSVWEYLSSVGAVAQTSLVSGRLGLGCKFENVVLVPFDPYDFEEEKETFGDDAAEENMTNDALTLAETEVGIGLETSQGVELSTFRVNISIPVQGEESEEESEDE